MVGYVCGAYRDRCVQGWLEAVTAVGPIRKTEKGKDRSGPAFDL